MTEYVDCFCEMSGNTERCAACRAVKKVEAALARLDALVKEGE